jgi:hypothetical protein
MMPWNERIIRAHTAVTDCVSHGYRLTSERYFVWQEEGADYLLADNRHAEKTVTGTTDLFTRLEFDPWKAQFEAALEADDRIAWALNSIQYEENTGFWHYEWVWSVM